jgi:CRP/FNR family transcriptional regulator, anaerobic regulatory protein
MLQVQPVSSSISRLPGAISIQRDSAAAPALGSCATCALKRACLSRDLVSVQLEQFASLATLKRRVSRGASLCRAGDALQALYIVRSGAFKMVSGSRAGEEKVTGFHLSGDVIGLDAISRGTHGQDVRALEDSEVCVVPFRPFERLAFELPALQREVLRALSADINRDYGLMLLLGGMHAEQRLAAFFLSLSRRHARLGYSAERFTLRMRRGDIASYLGLTPETVSRLLARFRDEGLISTARREIAIKDMDSLVETAGFDGAVTGQPA